MSNVSGKIPPACENAMSVNSNFLKTIQHSHSHRHLHPLPHPHRPTEMNESSSPSTLYELDLFILQSEFPESTVKYRIFEKPYVQMVQSTLETTDKIFGILPPATAEGGSSTTSSLVGTTCEIGNYMTNDAQTEFQIQCTVKRRFRVVKILREKTKRLPARALVQFFSDPVGADSIFFDTKLVEGTRSAFESLHNFSRQTLTAFQTSLQQSKQRTSESESASASRSTSKQNSYVMASQFAGRILFGVRKLNELTELSTNEFTWRCLGALPLSPTVKLRVLRMISLESRLKFLKTASERAEAALRVVTRRNSTRQQTQQKMPTIITIPGVNDEEEETID